MAKKGESLNLGYISMIQMSKEDEMDYLLPTATGYYFQKRIPTELMTFYGGKKLIRKSLKTKDLATAKARCAALSAQVHLELDALLKSNHPDLTKTVVLTESMIGPMMAGYKYDRLQQDDLTRQQLKVLSGVGAYPSFVRELNVECLTEAKACMAVLDYDYIDDQLNNYLETHSIDPIASISLSDKLRHAFLKTEIDILSEVVKRDGGDYTPTVDVAPPVNIVDALKPALSMLDIYQLWLDDVPRDAKTANSFKHAAVDFDKFAGKAISDIDVVAVREYVNGLALDKAYKTIQNRLKTLKAMANVAIRVRKLPFNVFDQYKLPKTVGLKTTKRRPYTLDELNSLMANLQQLTRIGDRWLVLLGLTTGARIRELCQLHQKDVFKVDNVWCLKLINDDEAGQRVKNDSSHRRIPIHADLIAAGFIKWVQGAGDGMLFADGTANQYDDPSPGFGKRYSRWVDNVLGAANRDGLVFHSLRHNYSDLLKAHPMGGTDHAKALTGHTAAGVAATYGGEFYPLNQLVKIVSEIVIPVALPVP